MKSCARRCERACCTLATYFPLAFIYSITTWAVWVDAGIGFRRQNPDDKITYSKIIPSAIGVILYLLLNVSYTVAVFTSPGSPNTSSPSQRRGKYSILPTSESGSDLADVHTITVSSSGGARYCKKCQVSKPDRTHHCSTCKRCVLKMDHHCPWLATCLGLHNYKAFLLFLVYVSLFCWACFVNTAFWIYNEMFASSQYLEQLMPVNVIMLAIISGLIGLTLTGFTSWHIYLTVKGQTTIECLEKTRYLSGVRKQVEANRIQHQNHGRHSSDGLADNLRRIGDQVLEFHANAVPGVLRFEEGEEHTSPAPSIGYPDQRPASASLFSHPSDRPSDSPAQRALRTTMQNNHPSYADLESQRASDRYEEYLSEREASTLPNAFDLGWRKNMLHVLGPNPLLWWLPVCNTTGDGWRWEVSEKWVKANEEVSRKKEERLRNAQAQNSQAYNRHNHWDEHSPHHGQIRGGADRYYDEGSHEYTHEREPQEYPDTTHVAGAATSGNGSAMSMHTLKRPRSGRTMKRDFDTGSDGEMASFQVSGSEDNDSDSDIDQPNSRSRPPREDEDGDGWGRQW